MTDYAEAFMQKAREALRVARLDADHGHAEAAINRAYYAAFYAARSALYRAGESPRSHKGTRTRFHDRFVSTERIPRETAKTLHVAEQMRLKADYDATSIFDVSGARDLIEDVAVLMDAIEAMAAAE